MLDFLFGLFGQANPTRDWPPYEGQPLDFDLDRNALNGVPLGGKIEDLRFLGPDENGRWNRSDGLLYLSRGLLVEHEKERVVAYSLINQDPDLPESQPFPGSLTHRGETLGFADISRDAFVERFGDPYWRDDDDEETILFYEFPGIEWQVEFNPAGGFEHFMTLSEPLMADDEQRASYGVTKPWPPSH